MLQFCFRYGILTYGRLWSNWFVIQPFNYSVKIESVCYLLFEG